MGLEELRNEILRRTYEDVKKVEAEAAAEEKRILGEAEAKRSALLESTRKEAEAAIGAERGERIAAARLEAGRLVTEEKEALIGRELSKVRKRFLLLHKGKDYPKLLNRLAKRGVAEIGKGAVVLVNARDAKLLKELNGAQMGAPADFAGGVIVESVDGRIRVSSTLEDLFESHSGEARKSLNSSIFGKGNK